MWEATAPGSTMHSLPALVNTHYAESALEPTHEVGAQSLSRVRLFVTPWTVAPQAPLSTGFPRQESWSGLLFPPPGALSDSGIEIMSPVSAEQVLYH